MMVRMALGGFGGVMVRVQSVAVCDASVITAAPQESTWPEMRKTARLVRARAALAMKVRMARVQSVAVGDASVITATQESTGRMRKTARLVRARAALAMKVRMALGGLGCVMVRVQSVAVGYMPVMRAFLVVFSS